MGIITPFMLWKLSEESKIHAFSFAALFKGSRNNSKGRIKTLQYSANYPIEDRVIHENFKKLDGFVTGVFDGHGGYQVAEFVSQNLVSTLEKYISEEMKLKPGDYYSKPIPSHQYKSTHFVTLKFLYIFCIP